MSQLELTRATHAILAVNANNANHRNGRSSAQRKVSFPSNVLMQQAISEGDVREMAELVDQYGIAIVDSPEPSGLPPVMRAVFECQQESLQFLVEAGANLAARDQEGWNALHVAAAMDDLEAARYILQHCGFNSNNCSEGVIASVEAGNAHVTEMGNAEGQRPIDLAASVEMATLLLDAGMALRQADASEMALIEIVQRQLNVEGTCDIINAALREATAYDSLLHLAADRNYTLLIKYLVDYNVMTLDVRDRNGWTPLHVAAYCNNTEAVLLAIRGGAALCAVTDAHQRASDLTGHNTIRVLLEGVCI